MDDDKLDALMCFILTIIAAAAVAAAVLAFCNLLEGLA